MTEIEKLDISMFHQGPTVRYMLRKKRSQKALIKEMVCYLIKMGYSNKVVIRNLDVSQSFIYRIKKEKMEL